MNEQSEAYGPALPGAAADRPVSAPAPLGAPQPAAVKPDNPPWSLLAAGFVWLASVGLLFLVQLLALAGYAVYRRRMGGGPIDETLLRDPKLVLVAVASVIPAHALTFALVWWLVTGGGQRAFKQVVGWRLSAQHPARELGLCAVLAVVLLMAGGLLSKLFGGTETDLEKIITSSLAARFAVAFLATFSAPLVEEAVYRGVLYPALQRRIGAARAVLIVTVLFAAVHVMQYWNNLGVILAVGLLSLMLTVTRAATGRLLPCVIIHFIFNGIQSALIIAEPYLRRLPQFADQPGAFVACLVRAAGLAH